MQVLLFRLGISGIGTCSTSRRTVKALYLHNTIILYEYFPCTIFSGMGE